MKQYIYALSACLLFTLPLESMAFTTWVTVRNKTHSECQLQSYNSDYDEVDEETLNIPIQPNEKAKIRFDQKGHKKSFITGLYYQCGDQNVLLQFEKKGNKFLVVDTVQDLHFVYVLADYYQHSKWITFTIKEFK